MHNRLIRFRHLFICAWVAIIAAHARAQTTFESLQSSYAPYMDVADDLAFPVKVRVLTQDPYTFYRGSKDLFFIWAKQNCADWLADHDAYLPSHADLHLGNIGTYPAAGEFGKLAFGMVDFDDADILPFQIDLLQGVITLDLIIQQQHLTLTPADQSKLIDAAIDAYRAAVNSDLTATALLADNPAIQRLMKRQSKPYATALEKFVGADGKFVQGPLKQDVLRPAGAMADDVAIALSRAIIEYPAFGDTIRYKNAADIRAAIIDVTQRTRYGSSGSQGLKKYFVLMRNPLVGIDQNVILYLKQEIPSAARRQSITPPDDRRPGRHVAELMAALTQPQPYINGWCEMRGGSYWINFREPWTEDLDASEVKSLDNLFDVARIWGTVAGATPAHHAKRDKIIPALTPEFVHDLSDRAAAYVKRNDQQYAEFCADPQVIATSHRAEQDLSAAH